MGLRARLLILLCCLPVSALAKPLVATAAVVDAVQMPAWLVRDGQTIPLAPGLEVRSGDKLRTGAGARAYVRMAEGSTVKLGESAFLNLQTAAPDNSIFKATMDVLKGAFRFTTAEAQKLRHREVAIRVGAATIGIRGTDVWGKSGADGDLVMLIEGDIELQPAQGEAFEMRDANLVFTAPKGGAAAPLTTATQEEFDQRRRETDIWPGDGAVRPGGRWSLLLGGFDEEKAALAAYDQARDKGYAARIRVTGGAAGAWHYAVLISGFPDRTEASVVAARVKADLGIDAETTR